MFGSTYLHQTFTECVPNQYTHFDMPNVTASYGKYLDSIALFLVFLNFLVSILFQHSSFYLDKLDAFTVSSHGTRRYIEKHIKHVRNNLFNSMLLLQEK